MMTKLTKISPKKLRLRSPPSKESIFHLCDESEILEYKSPNHYLFKYPGQYQACDYKGNSLFGTGTPTIWHGKYRGNADHIYATPEEVYEAQHTFYALLFPQGLRIGDEGKTKSLRELISENQSDEPLIRAAREWRNKNPTNPILDQNEDYQKTFFQREDPVIVCFRKDYSNSDEKIVRISARPWQVKPGVHFIF